MNKELEQIYARLAPSPLERVYEKLVQAGGTSEGAKKGWESRYHEKAGHADFLGKKAKTAKEHHEAAHAYSDAAEAAHKAGFDAVFHRRKQQYHTSQAGKSKI